MFAQWLWRKPVVRVQQQGVAVLPGEALNSLAEPEWAIPVAVG